MPPVNLDGVPEPEEPHHGPNLVIGGDFSAHFASRQRTHSDSFRRLPSLSHGLASTTREDFARPRARSDSLRRLGIRENEGLRKQRSATAESRRKIFQHARSNSSPPAMNETDPRLSPTVLNYVVEEEKSETGNDDVELFERQDTMTSNGSFKQADNDDTKAGTFDFDSPLSADTMISSIGDTGPRQKYLFGYALPMWSSSWPNATRVSTWIAKHAPCFWCSREALSLTTTNQAILLRLSSLCGFLGLCQAVSASFMLVVMLSDTLVDRNAQHVDRGSDASETVPALWNINTFVFLAGFLGTCVLFVMILARPVFRELDVTGSLRFMWLMLWIIPLEVFATIGMFDYHGVTDVWIMHWWTARLMAWFRSKSCAGGTYNTECVVPIDGLPDFESEDEWCENYYNHTRCSKIRDGAQDDMAINSYTYYNVNGALGVVTVLLLCLTVNFLEGIITRPIVQKSRESNIPLWLTLPIIGCFLTGAITLFSPSSILQRDAGSENFWPGVMYFAAGGLFFIAALLGYFLSHFRIMNQRDKRTKRFAVLLFIFVMTLSLVAVATIFIQSILLSTNIVNISINNKRRGELACSVAEGSCSYCNDPEADRECPEWNVNDVKKVLQTQLKSSAALAAIFMIYSVGALRFGFILWGHITRYQIDYV